MRDGYDPPFLIYFGKGTRPLLRRFYGRGGEAQAIRTAVAEHLSSLAARRKALSK